MNDLVPRPSVCFLFFYQTGSKIPGARDFQTLIKINNVNLFCFIEAPPSPEFLNCSTRSSTQILNDKVCEVEVKGWVMIWGKLAHLVEKRSFFFKISMMILCDIIYVIKRQESFPKPFSWGKNIRDFTLFFYKTYYKF